MSDSGRQIGDCMHGKRREFCIACLQDRVASLENQVLTEREDCARDCEADAIEYDRTAEHLKHRTNDSRGWVEERRAAKACRKCAERIRARATT